MIMNEHFSGLRNVMHSELQVICVKKIGLAMFSTLFSGLNLYCSLGRLSLTYIRALFIF